MRKTSTWNQYYNRIYIKDKFQGQRGKAQMQCNVGMNKKQLSSKKTLNAFKTNKTIVFQGFVWFHRGWFNPFVALDAARTSKQKKNEKLSK